MTVLALTIMLNWHGHNGIALSQQKLNDESNIPVADYTALATPDDKERKSKSDFYNKRHMIPAQGLPIGVEPLPVIDHLILRLPALPSDLSDAVISGTVTDSRAYLSTDKTGVYSEFSVQVEEVFKYDNLLQLNPGDSITVTREGGRVRYPSGRVQRFSILYQGFPNVSTRYVLFLKRVGQTSLFSILTGYELRSGKVFPLDGGKTDGQKVYLPFNVYEESDENVFLETVRRLTAQSSPTAPRKKG